MHWSEYQKKDTEVARGNNLADWAVKEAARGTSIMPLVPVLDLSQFNPEYLTADLEKVRAGVFYEEDSESRW